MERQLVIITAMIERLRRRWSLQRGQRKTKDILGQAMVKAELEEEGQYTRMMLTLESDDPMAYTVTVSMKYCNGTLKRMCYLKDYIILLQFYMDTC